MIRSIMKSNAIIINGVYNTLIQYENNRPYIKNPCGKKIFLDSLTVADFEKEDIHTISIGILEMGYTNKKEGKN